MKFVNECYTWFMRDSGAHWENSLAPFTWGKSPQAALDNSIALEMCAKMALMTWQLNPNAKAIPEHILNKHHERKHGAEAYYGQQ